MRTLIPSTVKALSAVPHQVHRRVGAIARTAIRLARAAGSWHHARMSADPMYPVALAAAGSAFIQMLVPNLTIAKALRELLKALIGSGIRPAYATGIGYRDDWDDD